jgi:hypothetical protein
MNLFCCFRKKINTNVKNGALETVNVLVTEDRFTEMSTVSDYNKSISFFNREDDDIEINDLIDEMIWHVEIKNLF